MGESICVGGASGVGVAPDRTMYEVMDLLPRVRTGVVFLEGDSVQAVLQSVLRRLDVSLVGCGVEGQQAGEEA